MQLEITFLYPVKQIYENFVVHDWNSKYQVYNI